MILRHVREGRADHDDTARWCSRCRANQQNPQMGDAEDSVVAGVGVAGHQVHDPVVAQIETLIVGLRHRDVRDALVLNRVFLRREPDNRFDDQAIQVFSDADGQNKIGYICREHAPILGMRAFHQDEMMHEINATRPIWIRVADYEARFRFGLEMSWADALELMHDMNDKRGRVNLAN